MNTVAVLYGVELSSYAYEPVLLHKSAFSHALERVSVFPGVRKVVVLVQEGAALPVPESCTRIAAPFWSVKILLETLAKIAAGSDLLYFAWADCPFLDPRLAESIAQRHLRYKAEYSYADGWPAGLAPEVLAPSTAALLAKLASDNHEPVKRDTLFSVIQKDINSFDIETEIAPVDLRPYRLQFSADSKRTLLLLTRFAHAGLSGGGSAAISALIQDKPELLRTLPVFYAIAVTEHCPQRCALCPYPLQEAPAFPPISLEQFSTLLDNISAFSGDAVIDLSLWGEIALHPHKIELIQAVLSRPALSLIIETSGIGWKESELQTIAEEALHCPPRINRQPPVSWILSLDAYSQERYRAVRGSGYEEAITQAHSLLKLFPQDTYVQAVRVNGAEDDIEQFYRFWKGKNAHIIIQKYDDFCGVLPFLQASDLSPLIRRPCWHLSRDMAVLLDGTVPSCREDLSCSRVLGNVFTETLETIWLRGESWYAKHCTASSTQRWEEMGLCARCDEYYTYNF
ncbi:MAG: spiro-SPASM protein [Spirochaetaceae bacterium]|jgi:spiro-SPASM protein|nr:spiro-SPASM protein [Spirochaetaceae bacterium]